MSTANTWSNLFYSKSMRNLLAYLMSCNMETQVVAIDGSNAENIQTTGTKQCMINGVNIVALAADAELDISAEPPYAAWSAAGASYVTTGRLSEVVDTNGDHWVCILAHTSSALNGPLTGLSSTYWKRLTKFAVSAVGNSVAQDTQGVYLICARADGTLAPFMAYKVADVHATATPVVIPAYDPERYVAIGMLKVIPTSGAHILGTTALTTVGTFTQLLGHVFPDASLLDSN